MNSSAPADPTTARVDSVLRGLAPQVLASLTRRFRQFDLCEDAVQEAMLAASIQWPRDGIPENPRGWLITVASRRLADLLRSEHARHRREDLVAGRAATDERLAPAPHDERPAEEDDTLTLLLLCCHPSLSAPSQIALTLRAVGGLTTAQIARAFLVPEATMAQRISRAKQTIKSSGAAFTVPPEHERAERMRAVLHVLYLIFNEGYTASSGVELQRVELTADAIRLTRELHRMLPEDGEVAGLLALMLLTDARRAARTAPDGALIPLSEQDRSLWDRVRISEGQALVADALSRAPVGTYQLQAAIAAVHSEASAAPDTDWAQILGLYGLLERVDPSPMVTLNRAVALGMVKGPRPALELLKTLDSDARLAEHHRLEAVRAHLLEMAGDRAAAHAAYAVAARRTTSVPEQRYLESKAAVLASTATRPAR